MIQMPKREAIATGPKGSSCPVALVDDGMYGGWR